jgi:hypothetical protein
MAKKKKSGAHNPTTPGGADSVRGNLGSLIDKVKETNGLLEASADMTFTQTYALQTVNNVILDIYADVHNIAALMTGNSLKEKERSLEEQKNWEEMLKAIKDGKKPAVSQEKKGDFSWLGLAASLVAGLVMGGIAFIKNYIKGLQVFWTAMAKALKVDGLIASIFTKLSKGFTFINDLIGSGFAKASAFVKGLFGEMKWVQSIKNFFGGIAGWVSKTFNLGGLMDDFAKLGKDLKGIWEMMGKPLQGLSKIFGGGGGGLLSYFDDLLKFFSPLTSFFKGLGTILGKLALPLQVIMAIWDTVSGALDGWNKTEGDFLAKFMGAMSGAITGLLNGLIGGLLDLLKDGLSWILSALGFDKAASILDSFSFSDLISKIVGGLFSMVENMVRFVIDIFEKGPGQIIEGLGNFMSNMAEKAKDVLKSLLRMVLPNPAGSFMEKLAAKAIPDSVYAFAGMDPKTGKTAEASPEAKATEAAVPQVQSKQAIVSGPQETLPQAQDRLNKSVEEGEMTKADANVEKMKLGLRPSFDRARPQGGAGGGGGVVPITASTTKWDPEDAMARGAR